MTNEISKVELFGANRDGLPISFIVASSATIAKGTLLELTDPRTASANTTSGAVIAGIANAQKSADWSTRLAAWTQGIFTFVASGACTVGAPAMSYSDANYPNTVGTAAARANPASGAQIIGTFMETVADGANVEVRVNL